MLQQSKWTLHRQFLCHRDFGTFDYANLANLLHPGFQDVRWARDQPMPGLFLAPPPNQGKGPGNEVAKPVLWEELFSLLLFIPSFVPINLDSYWPCE